MKDTLPIPACAPVRIRKLAACTNPVSPSSSWAEWQIGQINPASLPVGYEIRGVLLAPIQINEQIQVHRFYRNGVRADGCFGSTTICELRGNSIAVTFNSVYEICLDHELSGDVRREESKSRNGVGERN